MAVGLQLGGRAWHVPVDSVASTYRIFASAESFGAMGVSCTQDWRVQVSSDLARPAQTVLLLSRLCGRKPP